MKPLIQENDIADILVNGSSQLSVYVPESFLSKIFGYMDLLLTWGAKMNLTSLRDPVEIAVLHFLDSLTVFKVLPPTAGLRVIDVGSGAGFPGMVLKIVDPSLDMTLLDRDPKKIVFLKHVAHQLRLQGITFVNQRLEDFLQTDNLSRFDVAVSRAVSSDPCFMDSLHFLLHPGGSLIRMLGPRSDHKSEMLENFVLIKVWEGFLPFISQFRKVNLYSRKSVY